MAGFTPPSAGPRASRVRMLAEAAPGPPVMTELLVLDPAGLDPDDRLYYLEAWDRQQAWVTAQTLRGFLAVAGARPEGPDDFARDEISAALRLTAFTAQQRLEVARALSGPLAATREALEGGRVSYPHAAALVAGVAEHGDEIARAVEERVLPQAETQTVPQFKRAVKRAVAAIDPLTFEVAHEVAAAHRKVVHYPEPDGMASVAAYLPAADAQIVWLALDAVGRAHSDPGLGIDARRADALVRLATEALEQPGLPRRHRRPARIQVTIDLATLVGLADNPAELAGYGPIPAEAARLLAADSEWQRLVVEPVTGHLLDYGRTRYTPTRELADYLAARDVTCRFPPCSTSALDCDIDHAVPFHRGGSTSVHNCGHACRRHHRLKQSGWDVRSFPDGSVVWTSPRGRSYRTPAFDHQYGAG